MINKVTWDEVQDKIRNINPHFTEVVNKLSLNNSHKLYSVSYTFGDMIMKDGQFNVPHDGHFLPITDPAISPELFADLGTYDAMPLGIVLNNSFETFITQDEKVMPFELFEPGKLFSLWTHLDAEMSFQRLFKWNRTAGCRSLFALPKISDTYSHQRLQRALCIDMSAPRTLQEQWQLFVEIYRANRDKCNWDTEVLYLSKQWLLDIKNNPKWHELHLYLLSEAWSKSSFWRNEVAFRFIYNNFLNHLTAKGIKTKPKILAVVKHLILIGLGLLPAFCPATHELQAPINLLQESYLDFYNLKDYIPTLMQPKYFSAEDNVPVYYSLQWDTTLEPYQDDKTPINIMDILEDVQRILDQLLKYINLENRAFHLDRTPLSKLKKVKFDFYHSSESHCKDIKKTHTMPDTDERLIYLDKKTTSERKFCESAHFLRGCVKISCA